MSDGRARGAVEQLHALAAELRAGGLTRSSACDRIEAIAAQLAAPEARRTQVLRQGIQTTLSFEPAPAPAPIVGEKPGAGSTAPIRGPSRSATPARRSVTAMLNDEQRVAAKCAQDHCATIVEARAGTGKTTLQVGIAERLGGRGQYIAYNKDVGRDAKERFPANVKVTTGHAMAYADIGAELRAAGKELRNFRVPEVRALLGLSAEEASLAYAVRETMNAFLLTADDGISTDHVPFALRQRMARRIGGRGGMALSSTQQAVVEQCRRVSALAGDLWAACRDTAQRTAMPHDGYFRLWYERDVRVDADYLLLDEYQDTVPVMQAWVSRQSCKLIAVGDRWQQLYAYRGAINAMDRIKGEVRHLTQTFRFGPAIAEAANAILRLHGEANVLVGAGPTHGRIGDVDADAAFAVLSRTNAGLCLRAAKLAPQMPTAIVGGASEIVDMMQSAFGLYTMRRNLVTHPLLMPFETFKALEQYVSETDDRDCALMVKLVNEHGPGLGRVIEILRNDLAPERQAKAVLSTVHKAKGREWRQVVLDDDFKDIFDEDGRIRVDEANILYVAATRAREVLQPNAALVDVMGSGRPRYQTVGSQRARPQAAGALRLQPG